MIGAFPHRESEQKAGKLGNKHSLINAGYVVRLQGANWC